MRSSWKIGEVARIGIHVHASFAIILAWVALGQFAAGHGAAAALEAIGFTLAVFGIIVLHELGHAFAARYFGIRTRHITLYPIGGVAMLESMPRSPGQELVIALAGPAVNVVLAAGLFGILVLTSQARLTASLDLFVLPLLVKLLVVNLGLAAFNLIPAFPMDGGRVLRAVLAMRLGFVAATRKAVKIGRVIALGMALVGVFFDWLLVLVAFSVWTAGAAEEAQTRPPQPLGAFNGPGLRFSWSPAGRPGPAPEETAFVDDQGRLVTILRPGDGPSR